MDRFPYKKFEFQGVTDDAIPLLGVLAHKVYTIMFDEKKPPTKNKDGDEEEKKEEEKPELAMDKNRTLNLAACYYMSRLLPDWNDFGFYTISNDKKAKERHVPKLNSNSCYCDSVLVAIHTAIGVPKDWILNEPELTVIGAKKEANLHPYVLLKDEKDLMPWMANYFTFNQDSNQKNVRKLIYNILKYIGEGGRNIQIETYIHDLRKLVVDPNDKTTETSTGSQEAASYFYSKCTFDAGLGSIFSPILCIEEKTEYSIKGIPPHIQSNICSTWDEVKSALTLSSLDFVGDTIDVMKFIQTHLTDSRSIEGWKKTDVKKYMRHASYYTNRTYTGDTRTYTKTTLIRASPVMAVEVSFLNKVFERDSRGKSPP